MNVSDLRNMTDEELNKEMNGLMRQQFILRIQKATGQLTHHHLIRDMRKKIARVKTILTEKKSKGSKGHLS